MRLSVPDKNEFLKAAVKAADRESLARWIVSVVDAVDALPEGKADTPAPPYVAPAGNGHAHPAAPPSGQLWSGRND